MISLQKDTELVIRSHDDVMCDVILPTTKGCVQHIKVLKFITT